MMESGKYGWEWHDDSSKEAPETTHPKGDHLLDCSKPTNNI
jgi:hypothetical protein